MVPSGNLLYGFAEDRWFKHNFENLKERWKNKDMNHLNNESQVFVIIENINILSKHSGRKGNLPRWDLNPMPLICQFESHWGRFPFLPECLERILIFSIITNT